MRLYNTLAREIEQFRPLEETVRIYTCGPTVYDHVHIGNLRSFVMADMLRRAFTVNGFDVHHVMNLTDVDDKTIRRSQEKYPEEDAGAALAKLAAEYADVFMRDMRVIGNDTKALSFINATDAISAMQQLIRELHEGGFAYVAEDGVYFSIEAYQNSGKTYGRLVDVDASNTSAARINNDEYDKDSVHDFALWKRQQSGEPAWEFTLEERDLKGRPGWHIECSAMSTKQLGQPFDVHTGGIDLMFPHHENEIAQSTAGKDTEYARYFVHQEHLLVENRKMAKSRNNYTTLPDIEEGGFDPLAFRLLTLQAHYRSRMNFTWESLKGAQRFLQDIRAFADLQFQPAAEAPRLDLDTHGQDICDALADDLDTPRALAVLSSVVDKAVAIPSDQLEELRAFVRLIDETFGLAVTEREDITPDQRDLITQRARARKEQDYSRADDIRGTLEEQGIYLNDTPHGSIWRRDV